MSEIIELLFNYHTHAVVDVIQHLTGLSSRLYCDFRNSTTYHWNETRNTQKSGRYELKRPNDKNQGVCHRGNDELDFLSSLTLSDKK